MESTCYQYSNHVTREQCNLWLKEESLKYLKGTWTIHQTPSSTINRVAVSWVDYMQIASQPIIYCWTMSQNPIVSIFSQYELLERTAQHLSTLDLLYLGLTCSDIYVLVRKSHRVFEQLKRLTVCDGRGLIPRQQFQGLYQPDYYYIDGKGPRPEFDEEIEVRVWNLKCDSYNALPCIKCGINVCEVGRFHV